jgi:hypothetical protein
MPAAGRVAPDAAAPADPRYAVGVHLHVVRVVGEAVVAPEVDRVAEDLRPRGVPEVGDPDGPAVAAPPGREGAEEGEVVAPGGPAGQDVLAALNAARSVSRRQLDEVAHLPQVPRIAVGDDIEPALAERIACLRARRPDPRASHLVDVVVAWVEGADDQLPAGVQLHVLVLPVAELAEDLGRLERVEQPRVPAIAHVVCPKPEAPRGHEHPPAVHAIELALDDLARARHACHVLKAVGDRRARRRIRPQRGARQQCQGDQSRSAGEACSAAPGDEQDPHERPPSRTSRWVRTHCNEVAKPSRPGRAR